MRYENPDGARVCAAGLCMDLAIQITLLSWRPNPDTEYVFYILAGMWGFSDGIWQTQINGKTPLRHTQPSVTSQQALA